jgi:hypothetical protein
MSGHLFAADAAVDAAAAALVSAVVVAAAALATLPLPGVAAGTVADETARVLTGVR